MNFVVHCIDSLCGLADIDAVIDLIERQLISDGAVPDRARIRVALSRALAPGSPARLFLLTGPDGTSAGFASGNVGIGLESGGEYLWLNELYVDPGFRRSGAGRAILSFVENWARERGVRLVACVTGKSNTGARAFYERCGYGTGEVVWVEKPLG